MNELEGLKQQLTSLEAQKTAMFDSGSADQVIVGGLNKKIHEVRQKISEIEMQGIAEVITEGISAGLEMFEVGDTMFTLEDLAIDPDAANILRRGIKKIGESQANKFLDELNTQKSVYESQLNAKDDRINDLLKELEESNELRNANAQLRLENEDLDSKRENAATQLHEAQAEIERLNSHVDDLRKDIATGSASTNVIDITSDAELEAAAQRLKAKKEKSEADRKAAEDAAKIRIYNVRQLDGTGAKLGATRADNGEEITFGWLEKGRYKELSDEEAARFRAEQEAAIAAAQAEAMESTPDADEMVVGVTEEDFRATIEVPDVFATAHGLFEGDVSGEVSPETFEEEVKRRLTQLEARVFTDYAIAEDWKPQIEDVA